MNLSECEQLRKNPEWQQVLRAYWSEQRVQKTLRPEEEGWVSRQKSIPGIAGTHLPRIHGKLMAYGLLKFRLGDRTEGVLYQVSAAGIEALRQLDGKQSASQPGADPSRCEEPAGEAA